MLVDTDVLIWGFKGNQRAVQLLDGLDAFLISSITYMELMQGAKNKEEIRKIEKMLSALSVEVIHLNESISEIASGFVKKYTLSHSLGLADALIGATAIQKEERLVSGNQKHFSVLEAAGLSLIDFLPEQP